MRNKKERIIQSSHIIFWNLLNNFKRLRINAKSLQMVLGKLVRRPAKLDRQLARDLRALAHRDDPYDTVVGKTMCSNDFYEGQGRLDGAFCEFTETEKMEYLTKLQKAGVVNIEMESLCFAALTHHAGIQAAVVCVTLLDRLKGDQVYLIC